ncbi:unnamed protein product [Parnassius mnemosyne]|uniref:Reverse transcriptase domain-containing protein n=1 Tax=Parnassius mnemosyne TaxID=213953 RepID=A0AAV1LSU7_9NEOP
MHSPAPWLTDDLKHLIIKKGFAKSKLKAERSDKNLRNYKKVRNRCNTLCRDAQRRHIHKSVENGDTAKVWKFLQSLGVGKASSSSFQHNFDIELLNQHFTSSSTIDSSDKERTLSILSSTPTPNFPPFKFTPFTDCDVKKNILSISSKAVGDDSVSRNMILPILEFVTPILTHILNKSISTSKFPEAWKSAQVIPLPKKAQASHFTDFRPISILPFLSKVLEKLVFQQLCQYLDRNSLLNPVQSGFRSGHSTTTALVKVTDDIRRGMDNKQLTVLVLLDFSNAFNTVDFDILLSLLRSINISPSVVGWFQSYLRGRRQRIRVEDKFSSWCELPAGVPQGGVLSPLLFAIFINSICHKISSLYHMYADDLQVYTQSTLENLPTAVSAINADLAAISEWSKYYGLKVNPCKSQAIIVGGAGMISRVDWNNFPSVVLNGVVIPYSSTVKNLGIHFDTTFSWSHQLKEVSRKTFAAMGLLRRLRSFLPIPTKIMLAQSLLLSILDYAGASYLDVTEDQLNKLERIQNLAIRFIFGLRKYDHVSEFRLKLKWLPIRLRRNLQIVSLLYCVLFDPMTPSYLKENFKFLGHDRPDRVLRSAGELILAPHSYRTKYFKNSFTVKAICLWNDLPSQIRRAKTLEKFKTDVKNYYLTVH